MLHAKEFHNQHPADSINVRFQIVAVHCSQVFHSVLRVRLVVLGLGVLGAEQEREVFVRMVDFL